MKEYHPAVLPYHPRNNGLAERTVSKFRNIKWGWERFTNKH